MESGSRKRRFVDSDEASDRRSAPEVSRVPPPPPPALLGRIPPPPPSLQSARPPPPPTALPRPPPPPPPSLARPHLPAQDKAGPGPSPSTTATSAPKPKTFSLGLSKPQSAKPLTIKLGGAKSSSAGAAPAAPLKVASVFGADDDDDEEEMPVEAKMRMRNVGRETATSAGPNSFGKTKIGFCDSKRLFEKQLQQAMDDVADD